MWCAVMLKWGGDNPKYNNEESGYEEYNIKVLGEPGHRETYPTRKGSGFRTKRGMD